MPAWIIANRGLCELAVAALLIVGFAWHERDVQRRLDGLQAAAAVAAREASNTKAEGAAAARDAKTEKAYDQSRAAPLAPLPDVSGLDDPAPAAAAAPGAGGVRIAAGRCAVPQAGPAAAPSDYRPTIRTPASAGVVSEGWDTFERSDVSDARDADAEVTYLQGLLQTRQQLCGGH